jgi:hypothetical protein
MGNPYKTEKDKVSGGFNVCFDFGQEKVKYYQIKKAGDHALDIIPYTIRSKNNSFVVSGDMKIGEKIHLFDYHVHRNVGPLKKTVMCPLQTSGQPCPICEEYERAKKAKGWDSEEAKALKPTRRVAYNVIDADDEDETVQIFDVSWFLFSKQLIDEAKHQADKKHIDDLDYAGLLNPADAMTVEFRNTMEKKGGFDTPEFKGFSFVPRENKYKGVVPIDIDEYMVLKSYKELEGMLYGSDEVEETPEPEAPVEAEAPRRSRREEPEAESAPRRSRRDEPDEDEAKACPAGMTFGKDYDTDDKCEKCDLYSECRTEYRTKFKNRG